MTNMGHFPRRNAGIPHGFPVFSACMSKETCNRACHRADARTNLRAWDFQYQKSVLLRPGKALNDRALSFE